jgi:hypothetical protein
MCSRLIVAVLLVASSAGSPATAGAQSADSLRTGVSAARVAPVIAQSDSMRADSAVTRVATPSRVPKYKLMGFAIGALSGVAFDLFALHQCSAAPSTNGIPACLGIDVVAPAALLVGMFGGTMGGWIAGALVDAAHR